MLRVMPIAMALSVLPVVANAVTSWGQFDGGWTITNDTGEAANDLHFEYEIDGGAETLPWRISAPPFTSGIALGNKVNFGNGSVADGQSIKVTMLWRLEGDAFPNITAAYWTRNGTNIGDIAIGDLSTTQVPLPAGALLLGAGLLVLGGFRRLTPG